MQAVRSWTRRAASKLKNLSGYDICFLVALVIVVVLAWVRLAYGVELTDEAYVIAQGRHVYGGSVPITDIWGLNIFASVLYSNIESIFRIFTDGLEGYFLFARQSAFFLKLLFLTACYLLLKNHLPRRPLGFALLLFIPFNCNQFMAISYFQLAIHFMLLASSLLIKSLLTERHSFKWSLLGGAAMALAALSAASMAFVAILMAPMILCAGAKGTRLKRTGSYILGGLIAATIFSVYVIVAGGGIDRLLFGIEHILSGPYMQMGESNLFKKVFTQIQAILSPSEAFVPMLALALAAGFLLQKYASGASEIPDASLRKIKRSSFYCFIGLVSIHIVFICIRDALAGATLEHLDAASQNLYAPLLFFTPALFLFNERKGANILLFAWLPSLLFIICTSFFAAHGVTYHWFLYYPLLPLSLFYYDDIVGSSANFKLDGRETALGMRMISRLSPMLFPMLLTCMAIFISYHYVCRDVTLPRMTAKVESGLFKGIHTTEANAEHVLLLENEIRANTSAEDKVLFLDVAPAAYLMTDATPFTPTTWDPMQYNWAYALVESEDLFGYMLDYFELRQDVPDKIIYITSGYGLLSVKDDNNSFAHFVKNNYILSHKNENISTPLYVYERTDAPIMLPAYTEEIEPLPASAMKYEMTLLEPNPSFTAKPQEQIFVDILLKNTGDAIWPMGPPYSSDSPDNILHVGAHVYKDGEKTNEWRIGRLNYDLYPGRAAELSVGFWVPSEQGVYTLSLDVVQEYIGWFEDINQNQPLVLQLEVVE